MGVSLYVSAGILKPQFQEEYDFLESGLNYHKICEITGVSYSSIKSRNNRYYCINLQKAFIERIEREGIPNRLNINDEFGNRFSAFTDGEGHLGINLCKGKKTLHTDYRVSFSNKITRG